MNHPCTAPDCPVDGCHGRHCQLNQLDVGGHGRVVSVSGDTELRRRLLEMGFCNGANVEVIRRAPFGDPIEFRLRGYCLSLRDEEAGMVTITPLASV
jgi:ferrous iron transport protein A